MVKVLAVLGTRPDAIKMCPLVRELRGRGRVETCVCVTGQHRDMLAQVLARFDIAPDFDLQIMQEGQTLYDIMSRVLQGMRHVLEAYRPHLVLVHGDTTTAFAAALACYYQQIPVAHVEAGLRTGNIYSPFPEELNRQAISLIARYHFAPTQRAGSDLQREGKAPETIYVTGNTVIDALKTTIQDGYTSEITQWAEGSRLLVVTAHRRENLGEPMKRMFQAVRRVVDSFPDVKAVFPMHPNPAVRKAACEILGGCERIRLTEPMDVRDFHNLMNRAYFILTDSGGVQEEAPALGKPVLVMRDTTERPEGLEVGALQLVGTDEEAIFKGCRTLLTDPEHYEKMCRAHDLYGNGTASKQIADIIERDLMVSGLFERDGPAAYIGQDIAT